MIKRVIKTILFIPTVLILIPIDILIWFFNWFFYGRNTLFEEKQNSLFDNFLSL